MTDDFLRPVEHEYLEIRNDLFSDPEFREALKPLDDAGKITLQKSAALATVTEEHRAGRLADEQVPRLRAHIFRDLDKAVDLADRTSRNRIEDLPRALTSRIFTTPPRGPETSEAKADIRMRLDGEDDPRMGFHNAVTSAIERRDGLALRLLTSEWGRDYLAARVKDRGVADAVLTEVRAKAAAAPDDLYPAQARNDLARLRRADDLGKAFALGLNLLHMKRAKLQRGETL